MKMKAINHLAKKNIKRIINLKCTGLRSQVFLLFILIFYISCYTVNDRRYLNIVFNDSKLNSLYLLKYVDSVQNKGFLVPDSISYIFFTGDTISENQRIVYFSNNPKEWYLINFDAAPCWIESIYNPNLSNGAIYDKRFISSTELERIRIRFINEILKKTEMYGKEHHIPDSILYDTKYK